MAPLSAAIAALAVVTGTAFAVNATDRGSPLPWGKQSSTPPTLHLAGSSVAGIDMTAAGRFVLKTKLPDGPEQGNVQTLTAPSEQQMEALAKALGLTRSDKSEPGVVLFTGDGATLRIEVSAGYRWSYSATDELTCADRPQLPETARLTSCGSTREAPPQAGQALEAADPILDALGLEAAAAVVTTFGAATTVWVQPEVAGLPTAGMETAVTVRHPGSVVSAYGWFPETDRAAQYPVISAHEAFKKLADLPQPMTEASCPEPLPGTTKGDCGPSSVAIVDARFGLSLQWGAEQPLLVPSWLFYAEGSSYPISQVAVEAEFLGSPHAVPPTYVDPVKPVDPVHPIDPGTNTEPTPSPKPSDTPPPPSQLSTFDSVAVSDDGRTIKVSFYGGVEACNTYELIAKETSDAVYLVSSHSTPPTAGVCIDIAELRYASVKLEAPIGNRRLIDAANNTPMPSAVPPPPGEWTPPGDDDEAPRARDTTTVPPGGGGSGVVGAPMDVFVEPMP